MLACLDVCCGLSVGYVLQKFLDVGPCNVLDLLSPNQRFDMALNPAPVGRYGAGFFGRTAIPKVLVAEFGDGEPCLLYTSRCV